MCALKSVILSEKIILLGGEAALESCPCQCGLDRRDLYQGYIRGDPHINNAKLGYSLGGSNQSQTNVSQFCSL